MKRYLFLLVMTAISLMLHGVTINVGDSLKITMPDRFNWTSDSSYVYSGYADDGSIILVKKIIVDNFSKSKVMENGDEFSFNLNDYDLLSSKSEGFFNFADDYRLKTYRHRKNGLYLYTFTSYMYDFPYIILYGSASTTDDDKTLNEIIDTIDDSGDTWWHRVWLLLSRAGGPYILFFIILALMLTIGQNNTMLIVSIVAGAFLLYPAWGDWAVFLPVMGVFAAIMCLCKYLEPESFVQGIFDGL